MEHDFIVGFTLFNQNSFRTIHRHFSKLEHAKIFANNVNIKDSCKLYVDYEYYKDKIEELKQKINEVINHE